MKKTKIYYIIINDKERELSMLNRLKEIYGNKIIENAKTFDDNNYYFYTPSTHQVFGISKTISIEEYKLLKLQYVEKKVYANNEKQDNIYIYLLEKGTFPFSQKKLKLSIFKVNQNDEEILEEILTKVYHKCYIVKLFDYLICFYQENYDIKLRELIETISVDLGYDIYTHEGIYINEEVSGEKVYNYIETYVNNSKLNQMIYSDVATMVISIINHKKCDEVLDLIKRQTTDIVLKNQINKDILDVMVKNDLNVSLSAKLLYMNRNSLLNKLDGIYKETGLNLQKFIHACAFYLLSNRH